MTATKNSASAQGAKAQTVTKPEISNTVISETGKPETQSDKTKVLTVEDRRSRAIVFNSLLEKQAVLKEAQTKMEAFAIGSDENSQFIQLKDGSGKTFQTGKAEILKPVVELIRSQLTQQIGNVETEILNFVI